MSGQSGLRGYLYQSIVTVIGSITDNEWVNVTLEPNTKEDKVDILWEYPDRQYKVAQVKSTIGSFSKKMIIDIVNKLKNDEPRAKKYSVLLVGLLNSNAEKFVKRLNQNIFDVNDMTELGSLIEDVRNIQVDVYPFNPSSIESQLYAEVHRFLSEIGTIDLRKETIEGLMAKLIFKFSIAGTAGKAISRGEFTQWIRIDSTENIQKLDLESLISLLFWQLEKLLIYLDDTEKFNEIKLYINRLHKIIINKFGETESESIMEFDLLFDQGHFVFVEPKNWEVAIFKSKDPIYIPGGMLFIMKYIIIILNNIKSHSSIEDFQNLVMNLLNSFQIYSYFDFNWKNRPTVDIGF